MIAELNRRTEFNQGNLSHKFPTIEYDENLMQNATFCEDKVKYCSSFQEGIKSSFDNFPNEEMNIHDFSTNITNEIEKFNLIFKNGSGGNKSGGNNSTGTSVDPSKQGAAFIQIPTTNGSRVDNSTNGTLGLSGNSSTETSVDPSKQGATFIQAPTTNGSGVGSSGKTENNVEGGAKTQTTEESGTTGASQSTTEIQQKEDEGKGEESSPETENNVEGGGKTQIPAEVQEAEEETSWRFWFNGWFNVILENWQLITGTIGLLGVGSYINKSNKKEEDINAKIKPKLTSTNIKQKALNAETNTNTEQKVTSINAKIEPKPETINVNNSQDINEVVDDKINKVNNQLVKNNQVVVNKVEDNNKNSLIIILVIITGIIGLGVKWIRSKHGLNLKNLRRF